MTDTSGDKFVQWCHFHDQHPSNPEAFKRYIEETTGWDGQQFSLTETERHWIRRSAECIEWLRLYAHVGDQVMLDSALRALPGPPPNSLLVE